MENGPGKARLQEMDRHLPTNYRPVSFTCLACKPLEHVIAKQIHSFLESKSILTDSQHGFRSD